MLHPLTSSTYKTSTGNNPQTNLRRIREMIEEGKRDPMVRAQALRVLAGSGIRARDRAGEAAALLRWVQSNFTYRSDILNVETLHSARTLLRMKESGIPAGDCDDFSILIASMAESVGIPSRLATTQTIEPGSWSHIYPELLVNGRWLAADATNANAPLGWEAKSFRKAVDMDLQTIEGGELGMIETPAPPKSDQALKNERVEAAKKAIDDLITETEIVLHKIKARFS